MIADTAYQWTQRLKQKSASKRASPWPKPEDSIGIRLRNMGPYFCWEATGPARQEFLQLAEEIKVYLEKRSDTLTHTVTWTMYMIGRTKESARPTVMFCCKDLCSRRSVRNTVEESQILRRFPGIVTGDSLRPPDFDCLVPLATDDVMRQVSLMAGPIEKATLYTSSGKPTTTHIYTKGYRGATSAISKATGGGIIQWGSRYFYLTVAHAFADSVEFLAEDEPDDCDLEFDIDGQSGTDSEDDELREVTSMGSASPMSLGLAGSDDTAASINRTSESSSPRVVSAQPPTIVTPDKIESNLMLEFGDSSLSGVPSVADLRFGDIVVSSTDGSRASLDYALVEILPWDLQIMSFARKLMFNTNLPPYYLHQASIREPKDADILVVTGSGGLLRGKISGMPSFMSLPLRGKSQELWTVRLDGELAKGDCGSWVIDPKTDDVYGHIVAGSPKLGVAYIIPAYQVLADLREILGGEIITPNSFDVSVVSTVASRPTSTDLIPQYERFFSSFAGPRISLNASLSAAEPLPLLSAEWESVEKCRLDVGTRPKWASLPKLEKYSGEVNKYKSLLKLNEAREESSPEGLHDPTTKQTEPDAAGDILDWVSQS